MKAKEFIPAKKPRNFVAKNAQSSGAGRHSDNDKKKNQEQGKVKYKKDLIPMEGGSNAIANTASRLVNKDDGKVAKLRAAGDKRREDQLKSRNIAKKNEDAASVAESDPSGLMHAARHLNKEFRITAEVDGVAKRARVQAQSSRTAQEKFMKRYPTAQIHNVEDITQQMSETGVAEGSFGSGYGSVFTLYVNTGEKPPTKTKTKKFKREDDAVAWAEDYADRYDQYPDLKMEIKDENGGVVWELAESQGVAEETGDKPFDNMMKKVTKAPTAKARNTERILQKKQREEKTRDRLKGGFGPSPADKLSIRKSSL